MTVPAAVTNAVNGIQTAVTNAGVLQGASDATLAPVVLAILAAEAIIASEIVPIEDVLDGLGPDFLIGGISAIKAVDDLNAAITACSMQSQLLWLQGYVGRMAINIRQRL